MGVPSPAIPSFTDGVVVHQADLNALASNLTNLYNYNQAGFFTQRPCVLAASTATQNITTATDTSVNFGAAGINTDNMWTASSPDRITVQHAGLYWLFAQARWPTIPGASLANGMHQHITINGTTGAAASTALPMMNIGNVGGYVATILNLAAGATAYLVVWHNAGSTQTLQTDRGASFLGAVFLTPSS